MKTTTFLLGLSLAGTAPAYAQSALPPTVSLLAPSLDPRQELARQQAIRELQARRHEAALPAPRKHFFWKRKHRHNDLSSGQRSAMPISAENESARGRWRD